MNGIFIITELAGPVADRIAEIQRKYDPKMAAGQRPHVTLAGSSGIGPIPPKTPVSTLRAALEPIAKTTAPIIAQPLPPMIFMQTNIVVLPLDPHGALRAFFDRIRESGLSFGTPRFHFSPHITLSYFPTLTPATRRELLSFRADGPVTIDRIGAYDTTDVPFVSKKLFELELEGGKTK